MFFALSGRYPLQWGSMTITIYTKPGCQQCVATKQLFEKAGHAPAFIDITKDTAAENRVRALGYLSLPVVYIDNNNHWFGFRPDLIGEIS